MAFVIILFWGAPCVTDQPDLQAQEVKPTEYQVKAAFIYNFLQFIDWPVKPNRNLGPFVNLCILGENPFGTTFEAYQGEMIRTRKLFIKQSQSLYDLKECQVVFISHSEKGRAPQIIKQANDLGILTIGDSERLAHQGVMINFYMDKDKVRFEINIEAARKAGFTISSHLLKLARIIREPS